MGCTQSFPERDGIEILPDTYLEKALHNNPSLASKINLYKQWKDCGDPEYVNWPTVRRIY